MKTLCSILLAMSAIAWADPPKKYTVTLPEGQIGAADLKAGEYKLLLHRDENKVEILDADSGEMLDVTGKLVTTGDKSTSTEVHSQSVAGAKQIVEIRIGGTNYRVSFPNS